MASISGSGGGGSAGVSDPVASLSTEQSHFLDLTNGKGGELLGGSGGGAAAIGTGFAYPPAGAAAAAAEPSEGHSYSEPEDERGGDSNNDDGEEGDEEVEEGDEYEDADDGGGHHRSGASLLADDSEEGGYHRPGVDVGNTSSSGGAGTLTRMNIDPSTPGKVVDTGREQTGRWTKEEHEAFLSALQLYGKEWKKVAAKVKTRTVVQTRTHAQKYFQKLQKSQDSPSGDESPQMVGDAGGGSHRKKNRRSSSATISAAQVISGLSAARGGGGGASMLPPPPAMSSVGVSGGGAHSVSFVTAGSSHTSSGQMLGSIKPASSRHGFSSSSFIKITAPDPTLILKTVGFPEPSPAATGKRKLAEIAAARMLAGVAGGSSGRSSGGFSRQDEDDDGPPTPPPPPAAPLSASTASSSGAVAGGVLLSLKGGPPPPPPLALDRGPNSVNPPKGLSLQIVNPDSLGVSFGARARSGNSPVTPWDGQLEALVSSGSTAPALDDDARSTAAACATEPSARPSSVHAAALPSHGYGRSPLHAAVCENNVDFARELLSQQRSALNTDDFFQYIHQPDELGYASLHSACALLLLMESKSADSDEEPASALEIVSVLLQAGADVGQLDRRDNTPLHWAARAGDYQVVEKLLLRANLDARNVDGETPLHWALRAGRRGRNVVAVLLESGARPNVLNNSFKRPIDVAVEGFLDDPKSFFSLKASFDAGKKIKKDLVRFRKEIRTERRESRSNLLIRSPHSRTLVLHHPECLEHHPKSATDWETPDRIVSIMRRVLPHSDATGATETSGVFPHEISVSQEFERAKLDLLRRVHSTEYLSFVNQLSKDLERQLKENGTSVEDDDAVSSPPPVVPFTPLVQRSMIKIDDASVKCGLSSDTSFSAGSLKAARRAAGAVQHAVDCVLVGRNRNAFCVVRPPGHHAGINGLLEGGESCGFCIFNNVAAGALYAISDDRLLCNRCAIVDIDVHHGNGTEEIVRRCRDPSKLFFFSIHLYDNDKRKRNGNQYYYKFYPGTGDEDDLALNIINVPIVPLWKEVSSAPTVSTRSHNTRQKARSSQDTQEESSETETQRDGSRASDGGSDGGSTTTASPRHPLINPSGSSGRGAYRQAIQSRLLPALRAFNPDLILISAGFDAAKGDVGNARHERGRERMGLDLEPEDYAWTTRKILEIADICCHGRVVSVLEGGYGRTPVVPQTAARDGQENALDRTVFSECAIRHLQAMIDPYDTEMRFTT